jgi:chromosome segregation ATPase
VNETLANPGLRGELEGRLSALAESEGLERDLQGRLETELQRWADQLPQFQRKVSGARDTLGRALLASDGDAHRGSALAEAAEALELERARAEAVKGELEQHVQQLQEGVTEAVLGPERRSTLRERLDAFMATQRQELERVQFQAEEWLNGVREGLEEKRSELEREREARARLERWVEELKQVQAELAQRDAELAEARASVEQAESLLEQTR